MWEIRVGRKEQGGMMELHYNPKNEIMLKRRENGIETDYPTLV